MVVEEVGDGPSHAAKTIGLAKQVPLLFPLPVFLLSSLSLGKIGVCPGNPHGFAAFITQNVASYEDWYIMAGLVRQTGFHLKRCLPDYCLADYPAGRPQIFRMHQPAPEAGISLQLVLLIADHPPPMRRVIECVGNQIPVPDGIL